MLYQMSAFSTKKQGSDVGVQLTFPQQFSRVYGDIQSGFAYAPTDRTVGKQDFVGNDFQAQYHREKYEEAKKRCLTAVADTKRAEKRSLVSHQGYYNLRPKELSRRTRGIDYGVGFGANIQLHNAGVSGGELEGGVLASKAGREYASKLLAKRVAELNALDTSTFDNIVGTEVVGSQDFAEQSKIELQLYARQLSGALLTGKVDTLTVDTLKRLLVLLFRYFSLPESDDDIDNYLQFFGDIESMALAPLSEQSGPTKSATFSALFYAYIKRIMDYLREMDTRGRYMNAEQRKRLSTSLVKSLGFSKLLNIEDITRALQEASVDDELVERFVENERTGVKFDKPGLSAEISSGPVDIYEGDGRAELDRAMANQTRFGEAKGTRKFAQDTAVEMPRGERVINTQSMGAFDTALRGLSEGVRARDMAEAEGDVDATLLAEISEMADEELSDEIMNLQSKQSALRLENQQLEDEEKRTVSATREAEINDRQGEIIDELSRLERIIDAVRAELQSRLGGREGGVPTSSSNVANTAYQGEEQNVGDSMLAQPTTTGEQAKALEKVIIKKYGLLPYLKGIKAWKNAHPEVDYTNKGSLTWLRDRLQGEDDEDDDFMEYIKAQVEKTTEPGSETMASSSAVATPSPKAGVNPDFDLTRANVNYYIESAGNYGKNPIMVGRKGNQKEMSWEEYRRGFESFPNKIHKKVLGSLLRADGIKNGYSVSETLTNERRMELLRKYLALE